MESYPLDRFSDLGSFMNGVYSDGHGCLVRIIFLRFGRNLIGKSEMRASVIMKNYVTADIMVDVSIIYSNLYMYQCLYPVIPFRKETFVEVHGTRPLSLCIRGTIPENWYGY